MKDGIAVKSETAALAASIRARIKQRSAFDFAQAELVDNVECVKEEKAVEL